MQEALDYMQISVHSPPITITAFGEKPREVAMRDHTASLGDNGEILSDATSIVAGLFWTVMHGRSIGSSPGTTHGHNTDQIGTSASKPR